MAAAKAALKDARFPQFAAQIGSPTPRFAAPFGVPDNRSADRAPGIVFIPEDEKRSSVMAIFEQQVSGRSDIIIDGLRAEYGAQITARIIEAEAADFIWESRVMERYLGQEADLFDRDGDELSRVLVVSWLDERWWIALCLIDGDAAVVELCWRQQVADLRAAAAAWPVGH